MRSCWFAMVLLGCEPMQSSGDIFRPVAVAPTSSPAAPEGGEEPLVPGEAPPEASKAPSETDPVALRARLAGVSPDALQPPPAPERPAPAAPVAAPVVPIPVRVPVWDPGRPPAGSTWGLRLLSTLTATLPPRAVMVLPDGEEVVVKAGDMLPSQRVVVWAVGTDRVELAHIGSDGPFATVETRALQALAPGNHGR